MNTFVLEKNENGDEVLIDVFAKMTKSRTIYITGEIDYKSATDVVATLIYLRSKKAKDPTINIFMNAWASDVRSVLMITDAFLSMNNIPIRVVVSGESWGAATILLAAADKAQAGVNTIIHMGPVRLDPKYSNMDDAERYMKRLKIDDKKIHQLYSKKIGKSIKDVIKMCEKDTYLSSKEALKLRIIDSIVGENK